MELHALFDDVGAVGFEPQDAPPGDGLDDEPSIGNTSQSAVMTVADGKQRTKITIMITVTIIKGVSGSPSDAALDQGCKIPTGETAAGRHRMRLLGDDRRVSVGRQEKSACQLGEGSASTLPEVKTEQLGVTSHGRGR